MGKTSFVAESLRGSMPLNWYPVTDDQRGYVLRRTPGISSIKTIAETEPVEKYVCGMAAIGDYLYVAIRCEMFENTTGYVGLSPANCLIVELAGSSLIETGTVWALNIDKDSPLVQIEGCSENLLVCDLKTAWALDLASPYAVTRMDFSAGSIAIADGYAIASVLGTGLFRISSLNDFSTWDPLDYGTAEGDNDDLLRILTDHRELWAFGSRTTEVYYNSGAADFPYARAAGGFIEHGIAAPLSAAKLDNNVYWLSDGKQVLRAVGYQPQIVSTRKLERIFDGFDTYSDAVGWGQTFNGHAFYWLTFPTENRTFVFDTSTSSWHERSWFNESAGCHEAHIARTYAYYGGKHYVGSKQSASIYELSDVYRDDNGTLIRRRLDTHELFEPQGRARLYHSSFEVEVEQGYASADDDGHMLEWSDDGGKTWSNQRVVNAGDIGHYADRVIFRRLGQARTRTYRYTTAHKGVDSLLGIYVKAAPGGG